MKTIAAILAALSLTACAQYEQMEYDYETATSDRIFLQQRSMCEAGDMDACRAVMTVRAQKEAAEAALYGAYYVQPTFGGAY